MPWWDSDWFKGAVAGSATTGFLTALGNFTKKINKRRKDRPKEAEQSDEGPFKRRKRKT